MGLMTKSLCGRKWPIVVQKRRSILIAYIYLEMFDIIIVCFLIGKPLPCIVGCYQDLYLKNKTGYLSR